MAIRLAAILVLGLTVASGCGPGDGSPAADDPVAEAAAGARADPRFVLLYLTCTLNKRYLAPYEPSIAFTPHLAAFARQSAVFANHWTESGLTGTAFASILSGAQADQHQVFRHPRKLHKKLVLVFEAFRKAGFDTFYWQGIGLVGHAYNYAQGVSPRHRYRRGLEPGDPAFAEVLARLAREPTYRALVVSVDTVTHGAYPSNKLEDFLLEYPSERGDVQREEIDRLYPIYFFNEHALVTRSVATARKLGLESRDLVRMGEVVDLTYRSRVNLLDALFGGVVEEIDRSPIAASSVVVFSADHGETSYRDGRRFTWTHGPDLDPEVIGVPFMLRDRTGSVEPGVRTSVTRSIDLYPTVAGLAGVELPEDTQVAGVDLSSALRGQEPFPELSAYSHGTLRTLAFVKPDVIERIRVSRKSGSLLYRWRPSGRDPTVDPGADEPGEDDAERRAWHFEVFDLDGEPDLDIYRPSDPVHREAADDLWQYRDHLISRYRAQNPNAVRFRRERIEALSDSDYEALRALGYIDDANDPR